MALGIDSNIAAHLELRAIASPRQLAVICPTSASYARPSYEQLTYAELAAEVRQMVAALQAEGLAPGARVAVMVPVSIPFFVTTFALFRAGLVPVFVDPGMGLARLKACLAEAAPVAFIGSAKAHLARTLFGWCRGQVEQKILVGPGLGLFGARRLRLSSGLSSLQPVMRADDLAAILFTSGSTGQPKGAQYCHGTFAGQLKALGDLFTIAPGEVDVCTFPLFALFAPALGMTAVVPGMDFSRPKDVDPRQIFAAVDRFGATNLFGSPALLRAVVRGAQKEGRGLPTLKRVVSAGAPVSPHLVRDVSALLSPGAQVFTPYGATEALPVACIGSDEINGETGAAAARGQGLCVGRPAPGITLRIIGISDAALGQDTEAASLHGGRIGEILVRGPQVTQAYCDRPDADRLAKVGATDGGPPWHRMGDLGYLDEAGRLWFCGRKSQRLVTADGELYTQPVEGIFDALPGVARSALVGQGARGQMRPVLCVEPVTKLGRRASAQLRHELLTTAAHSAGAQMIRDIRLVRTLPVDRRHNAKIFREQLKDMVDRGAL